ncbi:MAG: PAS domain S-box protein [Candidatus Thorarchaeota archaeon]
MTAIDPIGDKIPKTKDALVKILEQTVEGIAIIGEDMRIEYINDRICKILGRERNEILNVVFTEFVHPDDHDHLLERFSSRLAGEEIPPIYDTRVLHETDEPRHLQVRTTVLQNGQDELKILAQVRDVTEERRIQHALSEYVMKYSTLVETMNEGLGIIDHKGNLVYANTSLCRLLDYTEDELAEKTVADIMHGYGLDEVFETIKERMANMPGRYESHLIHRSGRKIPVMVSASPLHNEDGEYWGSFAIFTDITAQKLLKRDLETARNRALLYLDLMGHDIRNHLQEIQISTELLKHRIEDSSAHDFLDRILHAVSKSSGIISETKTIESLVELPLCERLLDETLNETVMAAILHFDDVEFQMSLRTSNARIQADSFLELFLSDLLSHACERCKKDKRMVWINLDENTENYALTVSDNGEGMTTTEKNRLLELGQPTVGIRLQLARLIVEKYNGTIEVLDRVKGDSSQGSTFKIIFPKIH